MDRHKIIPFYMAYPLPMEVKNLFSDKKQRYPFELLSEQEPDQAGQMIQDMEYLQQMYPQKVRKYRKNVISALDAIDYEGSMIYDEYPDKWRIYKLASDITERVVMDENREKEQNEEMELNENEKEWLSELIQMIVFFEIYSRRHRNMKNDLL